MKKIQKTNKNDIELAKINAISRDNKHYFYGIIVLVLFVILFRPEYSQIVLTSLLGAGSGFGFAQLTKK